MELATRIASGPTIAHSLTKYLVQESMDLTFREALELASAAQEHVRRTEDHKIAVQWFLDKNRGCRRSWAGDQAGNRILTAATPRVPGCIVGGSDG